MKRTILESVSVTPGVHWKPIMLSTAKKPTLRAINARLAETRAKRFKAAERNCKRMTGRKRM